MAADTIDIFEEAKWKGRPVKDTDPAHWIYLDYFNDERLGYLSAHDYLDRRGRWEGWVAFIPLEHGFAPDAPFKGTYRTSRKQWDMPRSCGAETWTLEVRNAVLGADDTVVTGMRYQMGLWDKAHDWKSDPGRLAAQLQAERPHREVPPCYAAEPVYCEASYTWTPTRQPYVISTTPRPRLLLLEDFARNESKAEEIDAALANAPLYWDHADLSDLPQWVEFMAWLSKQHGKVVNPRKMPATFAPLFRQATERYPLAGRLNAMRLVYFSQGGQRTRPQYGYMRCPGWEERLELLGQIAREQARIGRPNPFQSGPG